MYVPEESEIDADYIRVDPDTMSMLKELGMNSLLDIMTTSAALSRDALCRGSS